MKKNTSEALKYLLFFVFKYNKRLRIVINENEYIGILTLASFILYKIKWFLIDSIIAILRDVNHLLTKSPVLSLMYKSTLTLKIN